MSTGEVDDRQTAHPEIHTVVSLHRALIVWSTMGNHTAHAFEHGGCFVSRETMSQIDESSDTAHQRVPPINSSVLPVAAPGNLSLRTLLPRKTLAHTSSAISVQRMSPWLTVLELCSLMSCSITLRFVTRAENESPSRNSSTRCASAPPGRSHSPKGISKPTLRRFTISDGSHFSAMFFNND